MPSALPPAKFHQFERVPIVSQAGERYPYTGQAGTVLWRDAQLARRHSPPPVDPWQYVVYLPVCRCCRTFTQSHLQSLGSFDSESAHWGVEPQISFDLVMDEDMAFIEGTYRLPGKFWEVVIFTKGNITQVQSKAQRWASGITGIVFIVPAATTLNRAYVLHAMSQTFGYETWIEVQGPDSIVLR